MCKSDTATQPSEIVKSLIVVYNMLSSSDCRWGEKKYHFLSKADVAYQIFDEYAPNICTSKDYLENVAGPTLAQLPARVEKQG